MAASRSTDSPDEVTCSTGTTAAAPSPSTGPNAGPAGGTLAAGGVNPRTALLASVQDFPRSELTYRRLSAGPPGTTRSGPRQARLATGPGTVTGVSAPPGLPANAWENWRTLPALDWPGMPTSQCLPSGATDMNALSAGTAARRRGSPTTARRPVTWRG